MKKNKITGLIGTAVLHILLLILLLVIAIRRPQVQEEGGVPVMLGNTELSQGNADPYTLTDIDIMNEPEAPAPDVSEPETVPPVEAKEEIITQTEEETVAVPKKEPKKETPKKEKPKKETPKKDVPKKEAVKPKEKTEAEKRAEAEKAAAEKKAAAERAAAEAACFSVNYFFRRKQKCRWQKSCEGITMVKIHRIWFNTERMDREDHYKITLFSRPRVSIHVDEYIWSFIEENIVKPHKLMRSEKHGYLLDISFDQFDPAKHRYFPLSSYNGLLREGVEMDSANRSYFREDFAGGKDRTTWFSPNKIWTNCGDKVLNVDIKAANVSENITPREYADLLFDGIGAALVFNFKRLKREEFDGLKPKIDWSIVESFPFPAPFEEQRYIGDEGEIHVYSWDGRKETTLVGPYSVRKLYLEHFGES